MRTLAKIIGALALLIVFIVGARFASLNAGVVDLNHGFGHVEIRLASAMLIALVAGMLVGVVSTFGASVRAHRRLRRMAKEKRLLEQEVSSLRSLSIREGN